jgi:hypothetical protein
MLEKLRVAAQSRNSPSFRHYLLTAEPWVQSQVTSFDIRGKRTGSSQILSTFLQLSPNNHYSTIAPY